MAAALEDILTRLLVPDNAVLLQATNELREAFKDPSVIVSLCSILATSQNFQVRQYAAVLLRRKLVKAKHWSRVPLELKQGLKQTLLKCLLKETEKALRTAVAQLISTVAKHELSSTGWPELLQLLNQYTHSNNVADKEIGLFALSTIASTAGQQLKPHLKSLLSLFAKTLQDNSSKWVPFYTIQAMTHLVSCIGTEEMNQFQLLIPSVMIVIRSLAPNDEDQACEAMEIFDELVECEVAVLVPHIKPLIEMCLEIAASQHLDDSIRVKAMSIISWLTRLKKKTILKHKLVLPILDVLFPIMCQFNPDDDNAGDDDEDDGNSGHSPSSLAAQVIDVMALHLPPEKLIPPLMRHVEPALASNIISHKRAAYLILAVIVEGCSENIRNKYLKSFLEVICRGITDEHPVVRNAALFALGQFAEFLQPDISKYASELMPVLFEYLSQTCQQLQQGEKDPPSLTKTFYALETFCENLEGDLMPYLSPLMERLLTFLTCTNSVHARELAISAIGAVANAAKEAILPYFPHIIEHLKVYLGEQQPEHNMPLQVQAIDTLGVLARTVGVNNFLPMAHDCMKLGIELMDKVHDPDLRRCTYGLFASVSIVLKGDMAQYLPTIIERMIDSLQSTEGFVVHYADEENAAFTIFEDLEEETLDDDENIGEQEEDEDEDITGYSVENAYLEEKEDALCSLREISANVGSAFLPFLEKCFEETKKLIEHPGVEVRKAAISALSQYCITLHKVSLETGIAEHKSALEKGLSVLMPKLISTAREDTERQAVLACLETINNLLKEVKKPVLNGGHLDSIVVLIKDIFKHKIACQDEEDDEEEADAQQAEYDGMLVEFAGEVVPSLAKILPPQQFAPYFAGLLPLFIPKTKKSSSTSDKSFSIGTLAEVVEGLEKGASTPFINHLLPIFLGGMKDEDEEVRSNSVYGLGVLVENAGDNLFHQYPSLLQSLSTMLSHEDNSRAKDNICATVARFIMTNTNGVPLKQVLPVFLQCLPLQEDLEENVTVYKCIMQLYSARCEEFFQNLPQILKVISVIISSDQINSETRVQLVQLTKAVQQEFPIDFQTVLNTLSPENAELLKAVLASS